MFDNLPQVHVNFFYIVTMEKVAVAPTASKYYGKIIIDNLDRAKDVTSYSMNKINKCFKDLSEYQDSLATNNGVIDVDISEILDIKAERCNHV